MGPGRNGKTPLPGLYVPEVSPGVSRPFRPSGLSKIDVWSALSLDGSGSQTLLPRYQLGPEPSPLVVPGTLPVRAAPVERLHRG